MKDFILFFLVQAVSYSILTVNFRAVAAGHLSVTLVTDALNATLSFFVIRRIAKSDDSIVGWLGYLFGSLVGTTIGMLV